MGCRWIFSTKHNGNGSIERFRTCLVAKRFIEAYGIDYQKTFALVAKLNTIWVLISVETNWDWTLFQLDVKKCILEWRPNKRSVYKHTYKILGTYTEGKICKLKKSCYGLSNHLELGLKILPLLWRTPHQERLLY